MDTVRIWNQCARRRKSSVARVSLKTLYIIVHCRRSAGVGEDHLASSLAQGAFVDGDSAADVIPVDLVNDALD